MKPGQTKQFDTYDNREDRRELVIMFQRLGEGLPSPMGREVRQKFLEMLFLLSMSGMDKCPVEIDVEQCTPVGAYNLFIQFVGVLGVPIDDAAKLLDDCVRKKGWLRPFWLNTIEEAAYSVISR